uniref:Uncharacterized protein n=1 Tax=Romanomermis culicivorax TaxID=13658 RepID=A0A915IZ37_ROMCU
MKLLVAITIYTCYFWVMILSDDENEAMTASSHLRNNNTGDLLYVLELAFCQNKADGTTCNSAEGKVCMNGRCVSACRMNQSTDLTTSCLCNSTAHMCHLCCWSSANKSCQTASTYGIYMNSRNSMTWTLKNSLNGCPLDPFNNDGGACPSDATGRICDLVPLNGLEEPWVCVNRQCSRITCTHFNRILSSMVAYPSTIIDCQCRNDFAQYSACCRDLNNNTCYPYQSWVMGMF